MRKIIFVLGLLIATTTDILAQGVTVQNPNPTSSIANKGSYIADSIFRLGTRDTTKPSWWNPMWSFNGAFQLGLDGKPYYYSGGKWNGFAGSGGGSGTVTSISQGFGMSLSPSPITSSGSVSVDTSLIASKSFVNNQFAPISTTVRLTGVQTMFSKTIAASVIQSPQFSLVSNGGQITDSILVMRPSTGTVYLLDPAAISGGGTVYDSTVMATQYRLDTGKANLRTSINTKLNSTDTASLSTRIDARVKYTDTASMLGGYLLKVDTASLSNRINLKANTASPTFTGTVTIPTGANITTPNILGLTSGSTNDSLLVADASTGAVKRISFARISGGGGGGSGWRLTGNSGLSGTTNFIGNTDNINFNIRVNNQVVAKFANNEGLSICNNATTTGIAAVSIGVNSVNTGIAGISLGYQASNNSVNNGIALGRLCVVNHGGAFVSQDYSGSNSVTSGADNQWKAKFNGGFLFQTGTATHTTQFNIKTSGIINITNTPTYADNAAALSGGLLAGDVYRTSTGVLMIVY